MTKRNDRRTPSDVQAMGLREFQRRFGFRPRDAYEKSFFAAMARRPTAFEHEAILAGVAGDIDISRINMSE